MLRDRWTTIFGAIAGVSQLLQGLGIDFGHVGKASGLQLISALALVALGVKAKDSNPAGGK